MGGRVALPFGAPYNASKFAVEGLSESLRRELLPFGIDVIVIGPGAVATAIWAKGEEVDITPYLSTPFGAPLERLRELRGPRPNAACRRSGSDVPSCWR